MKRSRLRLVLHLERASKGLQAWLVPFTWDNQPTVRAGSRCSFPFSFPPRPHFRHRTSSCSYFAVARSLLSLTFSPFSPFDNPHVSFAAGCLEPIWCITHRIIYAPPVTRSLSCIAMGSSAENRPAAPRPPPRTRRLMSPQLQPFVKVPLRAGERSWSASCCQCQRDRIEGCQSRRLDVNSRWRRHPRQPGPPGRRGYQCHPCAQDALAERRMLTLSISPSTMILIAIRAGH